MAYKLTEAFRSLFEGQRYLHRRSNLGDFVAMHLYEDLYDLGRSKKFVERTDAGFAVLNVANKRQGINARRGDGSFGEIVPQVNAIRDLGYAVGRGPIVNIEIGVEVKILMKAMIKQIDRVNNDLRGQADQFHTRSSSTICIGVVGINQADYAVGYEGDRVHRTDGKKDKHPIAEADEAKRRLMDKASSAFDEFLILPFVARNDEPYEFRYVNPIKTERDYGAILARISQQYEARFQPR